MKNWDFYFVLKLATIALAALILILQVHGILHYPIWYDDSAFAIVAKNLAVGEGYQAIFFNKNYPFHFGISSGPTVILPAALSIFFFGNKFWVPQAANIFLIWSLLLTIFILANDFVGKEKKWSFCFFALLFGFLFSIGIYASQNPDRLILWHLLMGEIPAVLCVIIAAFLLFAPQFSVKKIWAGGLFLGLAVMSKAIVGIAAAVIFWAFIFKIFLSKHLKKFHLIFATGLCAASPFILFELAKIIFLGWPQYLELQAGVIEFYKHNAAAINATTNNEVTILSDVRGRVTYLQNTLNAAWIAFAPITIYILYSAYRKKDHKTSHIFTIALALIFSFFLYLFWWIYFSTGFYRYLAIAFICYFAGLSLILANVDYNKKFRVQIAVIFSFIFLLLVSREGEIDYLISVISYGNDKKMQEHLEIREAVQKLEDQGVTMISCGNNFELEYLLPRSRNFKKCEEILNHSFTQKAMMVSYFINPLTMPQYTARADGDQYYVNIKLIPEAILSKCNLEYLRTENYLLSWCK